jgi:hypothetical protein
MSTSGVIASRTFELSDGRTLNLEFSAPAQLAPDEWRCTFTLIGGAAGRISGSAIGIDSLQALQIAIDAARIELSRIQENITWLGGENRWTGLSRCVPISFGLAFQERLEQMILVEEESLVPPK